MISQLPDAVYITSIIDNAKTRISGLTIAKIAFETHDTWENHAENALNQAKAEFQKSGGGQSKSHRAISIFLIVLY